tara:strand:+ start:773 stop:1099 length:327 start_codon:yes stop_codon:yes gene_type:complete
MNQQELNDLSDWSDDMFGSLGNISGRNDRFLKKKISEMENRSVALSEDEQNQLGKYRVEMGQTHSGVKKPKVDWNYVASNGNHEYGKIVKGLWQPGREEAEYLRKNKL